MATAATGRGETQSTSTPRAGIERNPRIEHFFFSGMALLVLVSVFLGFAQTFYLRGIVEIPPSKAFAIPPLPIAVIIHGTIFTLWTVLLIAQTSLVAVDRVDLHRRLGVLGCALACLVVLAGLAVTSVDIARHVPPGDPRAGGGARQFLRVASFAVLAFFSYRQRRNPAAHKRLMLIATINLLPAAVVRWPVITAGNFPLTLALCGALIVAIMCYDLLSIRRVHRATLAGFVLTILVNQPIVTMYTRNAAWAYIGVKMQTMGRWLVR